MKIEKVINFNEAMVKSVAPTLPLGALQEIWDTPPSEDVFSELKRLSLKSWVMIACDDDEAMGQWSNHSSHLYLLDKLNWLLPLENAGGNFMYMFQRFHHNYREKIWVWGSEALKGALYYRLTGEGVSA